MRSARYRYAFTLIELLVVVAIVTVLIAILIPALQKAREQAKIVTCQANVRSIGQLLVQYAHEYQQWLPVAGDWNAPYLRFENLDVLGYQADARVYHCMTDQSNFTAWIRPSTGESIHCSYKSESPQPSGPIQWIFNIDRFTEFYVDQWGNDVPASQVMLAWDLNGYTHGANYSYGYASYGYSAFFADLHVEFIQIKN